MLRVRIITWHCKLQNEFWLLRSETLKCYKNAKQFFPHEWKKDVEITQSLFLLLSLNTMWRSCKWERINNRTLLRFSFFFLFYSKFFSSNLSVEVCSAVLLFLYLFILPMCCDVNNYLRAEGNSWKILSLSYLIIPRKETIFSFTNCGQDI